MVVSRAIKKAKRASIGMARQNDEKKRRRIVNSGATCHECEL